MVITSISNEKVRLFRSLMDAKGRKESGLYLAEGANLIGDIPADAAVRCVYVKESKEKDYGILKSCQVFAALL